MIQCLQHSSSEKMIKTENFKKRLKTILKQHIIAKKKSNMAQQPKGQLISKANSTVLKISKKSNPN